MIIENIKNVPKILKEKYREKAVDLIGLGTCVAVAVPFSYWLSSIKFKSIKFYKN